MSGKMGKNASYKESKLPCAIDLKRARSNMKKFKGEVQVAALRKMCIVIFATWGFRIRSFAGMAADVNTSLNMRKYT